MRRGAARQGIERQGRQMNILPKALLKRYDKRRLAAWAILGVLFCVIVWWMPLAAAIIAGGVGIGAVLVFLATAHD